MVTNPFYATSVLVVDPAASRRNDVISDEHDPSIRRGRDQAAVQPDETGDARDRAGALRDQAGGRRDRAGALRDQAGDRRDEAGDRRDEAGTLRDEAGDQRDQAGVRRDEVGALRDQAGALRDQAAQQRDLVTERSEENPTAEAAREIQARAALARREAASDRRRSLEDRQAGADERAQAQSDRGTASGDRGAGADERGQAGLDRGTASGDRGSGADERGQAGLDRNTALADRGASAREREYSSVDALTGAYLRGPGLVELGREIARARRSAQPLVLAFVDIDGLKAINDSLGHAAGDRLLLQVAGELRAKLRSYDLVIRYGGDEFLWVLSGQTIDEATKRLALVSVAVADGSEHGSMTVGLAELGRDESADDLVARADAELYRERRRHRDAPDRE
jgi:diguanylate cyclase (GGDEF)-like protein